MSESVKTAIGGIVLLLAAIWIWQTISAPPSGRDGWCQENAYEIQMAVGSAPGTAAWDSGCRQMWAIHLQGN